MVHGHDHNVDQHNGHHKAVEPGVFDDPPGHPSKVALFSPGDQVLPLEQHGNEELEVEPDIGSDVGCCSVSCQNLLLVVNLHSAIVCQIIVWDFKQSMTLAMTLAGAPSLARISF